MKKYLFLLIICLLFLPTLANAQDTADIIPKREKLLNGLPIVLLERPGSGSVAIQVVVKSGATFDLANKAGVADITSQMLLRIAGGYTAERLTEEINDLGARLEVKTGWDSIEIKMLGKNSSFDGMVDILNRILTLPKFRNSDEVFNKLKAERLKQLETASPANIIADETFYNSLYGRHPYGHNIFGTKESVARIALIDVSDFYNRFYIANNSAVVIAGDVTLDRILPVVRRGFGGWRKGNLIPYTFSPPKQETGINIRLVEDNSGNTEIRIGNAALRRSDTDYLPMQLLITILDQRLQKSDQKMQASLSARKLVGAYFLSGSVPTPKAIEAINNSIAEIKKVANDLQPTELQAAKDHLINEYRTDINTNTELAARWSETENYNLGGNYVKGFSSAINGTSLEDVKRAATKYLSTDNLTIAVMGNVSALEPELKKIGTLKTGNTAANSATAENKATTK